MLHIETIGQAQALAGAHHETASFAISARQAVQAERRQQDENDRAHLRAEVETARAEGARLGAILEDMHKRAEVQASSTAAAADALTAAAQGGIYIIAF